MQHSVGHHYMNALSILSVHCVFVAQLHAALARHDWETFILTFVQPISHLSQPYCEHFINEYPRVDVSMIGRHDTIERLVDGGGGWRMGLGDRRGVPTDVDVEEREDRTIDLHRNY
jgi:hypothetical protein